jgi:polyisoprenyl-phosphate glycosyltransferase
MFKSYQFTQNDEAVLTEKTIKTMVSVVCPAYQEQEVVLPFYKELSRVLSTLEECYDYEIILVDDGSKDHTLGVLKEIAVADRRFFYISLSKNFGHQAAITAGLEKAKGDLVITLDSDLQHPPELIARMITLWQKGNDVVLAKREEVASSFSFRQILRKLFFKVIGNDVRTMRSGYSDYRLLSRRALNSLLQFKESHRYLRGLVSLIGYPTAIVKFTPAERFAGDSKFGFVKLFRYAIDALFSFSRAPSNLIYGLGFCFFLGSVMSLALFAGMIYCGWQMEHTLWILMASVLLFCSSGVLFGQGILAEYISRVYEQVKNRPLYFVKDTNITN